MKTMTRETAMKRFTAVQDHPQWVALQQQYDQLAASVRATEEILDRLQNGPLPTGPNVDEVVDARIQRESDIDRAQRKLKILRAELDSLSVKMRAGENTWRAIEREIREQWLPEHRQHALRIASAMRELRQALVDGARFERSIGVDVGGPWVSLDFEPVNVNNDPTWSEDAIQRWLSAHAEYLADATPETEVAE